MLPRWVGLAVLAIAAMRATAVEVTLVGDAHVNAARPNANSGAISNLNVGAGYTSLLQFDLDTLPSGTTASQISRAVLRLYCNRADVPGAIHLQPVTSGWGEYSITYAGMPNLAATSQTFTAAQAGAYVWVDVTALVQGWLSSPSTNNGIALTADSATVIFDSKENDLTGHAPTLDVTLVSQGPMGPKGDTGAIGPQGPAGIAGPPGPQGAKGDPGPAGAVGATGPQGPAGSQGPVGPQGNIGPIGPAGSQGVAGPTGPQGSMGPAGPAGAVGARGPQGPIGMSFRGAYSASVTYATGDGVSYGNAGYVSLIDGNSGNEPDLTPAAWGRFATGTQGAQGAAGPQGPQGLPGPQGAMGPTGATGSQGPQGIQGVPGSPGATGPQGPRGPAGVNFLGAWSSSVHYSIADAVFYNGSTYLAVEASQGVEPDSSPAAWSLLAQAGSEGATGPAGTAATLSIGTVTTTAPGTQATVINSGTASAAILNFTIPQGAPGTNGSGGSSSNTGLSNVSMYHDVSFNANFYAVNNSNQNAAEIQSVLTWVPSGCTATNLNVYSQQANLITVTLRAGLPGAMANTALSCSVAKDSSCSSPGNVIIPAGNFIDLTVSGANGTAAAVWTALTCN